MAKCEVINKGIEFTIQVTSPEKNQYVLKSDTESNSKVWANHISNVIK